ncbi:Uma2 family endonuclease [Runella limosa]|uniref:Uma2 family endonuclease n=1 Tax=Runella limosa TaxID=370978 RepID=UPI00055CB80B|nr:Uma2 family endonuclease [Runella limosa]
MVQTTQNNPVLPRTLAEFQEWEPNDGLKYEWYDGELIQFTGMKKRQYYIYDILNLLFINKGYYQKGVFIAEPDVMLNSIQMRRPDIAYFTRAQVYQGREGNDVIPEFVVEIISETDQVYRVEERLSEYFKAGAGGVPLKVVWNVIPEQEVVYVYTSRRNVKICLEDDICSANPVLSDFEISVNELFARAQNDKAPTA